MTAGRAKKWGVVCWLSIGLVMWCGWVAGAQNQKGVLKFSIELQYDAVADGIPVAASLIPLKAAQDIQFPRAPNGSDRPVYVLYNLDIRGISGSKVIPVGSEKFKPKVTMFITWWQGEKPRYPNIYYYIPRPESGTGEWVSHADIASRRVPVADMQVSPIEFDSKEGRYYFTIAKWPVDDRMMCHDN